MNRVGVARTSGASHQVTAAPTWATNRYIHPFTDEGFFDTMTKLFVRYLSVKENFKQNAP
jgi:hypothetical protein